MVPDASASPSTPGLAVRCSKLGTTCLVLSILEFLYCLNRLASPLITRATVNLQRSFAARQFHGPAANPMVDAAQRFSQRIMVWELVRSIPFLLLTVVLFWIALRLRKQDWEALQAARSWVFWAFAAIALSVILQALVTVPATLDYQREISGLMLAPTAGHRAPEVFERMISTMTTAAVFIGMIMGTLMLCVWPTVLYAWTGKLLRELAPESGTEPALR